MNKLDKLIQSEFANNKNDITFPALMGFYRQFDPTLITRGAGFNVHLYDQVQVDPHAFSVLQKRASAIGAYPWTIVAASDSRIDKKAADFVRKQLTALDFGRIREEILKSELLYGFHVSEVMWKREGGQILLADIISRDQIRFVMDDQYKVRLKTVQDMLLGELVPERKFIWSTFDKRNNGPYGRGLGSVIWWPVFFKKMLIKFWLSYAERFASPTIVSKFPTGASADLQRSALVAAQNVFSEGEIAISADVEIDLLESKRTSTEAIYSSFIGYLDEEISKAVLGETVTTGSGEHASKAASQSHNDLRKELAVSDTSRLDMALNKTVVQWLCEFNFPTAGLPRLVTDTGEPNDLKKQAETDAVVASMGFRPSIEYINATYGGGYDWKDVGSAAGQIVPGTERVNVNEDVTPSASHPSVAGAAQVNINAAAKANN